MLIDCHAHLNAYDETRPPPSLRERADLLFQTMEEAGIDHVVILSSYKVTPYRPHVDEIIAAVGGDRRVSIVEGIRWRSEGERTDLFKMEERLRDGLVKGLKLYPGYDGYAINDPSLESVLRIAGKYGVPVMIHTGDTYSKKAKVRHAHPLLVDDLAVDYPETQFVMCHLGNPWFEDAAEVLYKNDNVLADISGLTLGGFSAEFERLMIERMRESIQYMGDPSLQLMYGSDWPLVEMKSYVKFFNSLDLTPEQREKIGWQTAARVFRIESVAS